MKCLVLSLALCSNVFLSSCATVPPEIEPAPPPNIPRSQPFSTVDRAVSGQVFWLTEGGDTVKVAGARIFFYDEAYLVKARATISAYSKQDFDGGNGFYSGAPGRVTRAKMKLQYNIDALWQSLEQPFAVAIADADGRFEYRGQLPKNLAIYCFAGRRTKGDLERIRWAVSEKQFDNPLRLLLTDENRIR